MKACDDGLCGRCVPCRREDFEFTRPQPAPVTLSPLAQRILDEGTGFQPVLERTPREKRPKGVKKPRVRASRAADHTPTPCVDCGEMRVVIKSGTGVALAGKDGRCELCTENPQAKAKIAAHECHEAPLLPNPLRRARRMLERVRGDNGRPFHPDATHGTSGYANYGCKCDRCRTARTSPAIREKVSA